jgi:hypothetical protein
MARITYIPRKFSSETQETIDWAEEVCSEYAAQDLVLTLRQIFYQGVARGLIPNKQSEYKRLGDILNNARLAGVFDWAYMVDRTRNVVEPRWWESPSALMKIAARQYASDLWQGQHVRIEVWIEKDAGIGVIEAVCDRNQVSYFSCRGYTSQTEMWEGAQRIRYHLENGERVVILHIGDHDPSGLDMSKDIASRLQLFVTRDWMMSPWGQDLRASTTGAITVGAIKANMRDYMRSKGGTITDSESPWMVKRIALNQDQIEQYNPPPNPAKQTDSRFEAYMDETGLDESWELDALDPMVLQELIQDEIDALRDDGVWAENEREQDRDQRIMQSLASRWEEVTTYLATHEVPTNGNGTSPATTEEDEG